MTYRIRKSRRGIIILVVLSLLALFVVLAVTFAIVAGQYSRTAKAHAKQEMLGGDEQRHMDLVVGQVLREPKDPQSVLWGHSLLRDLYGKNFETGQILSAKIPTPGSSATYTPTQGQVVVLTLSGALSNAVEGFYGGRVFTILDGPLAGTSTRILAYLSSTSELVIEMPEFDSQELVQYLSAANLSSDTYKVFTTRSFLINGGAFNGPGYGYSPVTANLDQTDNIVDGSGTVLMSMPTALTPNYAVYRSTLGLPDGDANEPFDVPDFRDMFLAMVPPNVATNPLATIIPSFHRPELINYWANRGALSGVGTTPTPQDLLKRYEVLRRITLRPLPIYNTSANLAWHTNFTGSNPADGLNAPVDLANDADMAKLIYALVNGPWDVDNDGDGKADSVWLDLQLPVVTATSGARYKPLVAILCRDLDGLLNVNAAGNLYQTQTAFTQDVSAFVMYGSDWSKTSALAVKLPRGRGQGPAEINLSRIYGTNLALLLKSRYASNSDSLDFHPGVRSTATSDDLLIRLKSIGLPERYGRLDSPSDYGSYNNPSAYGSYPDIVGRGVVALDHHGNPVPSNSAMEATFTLGTTTYTINERRDSPYQLNLVQPNGSDNPYSVHELESHLRRSDVDAGSLPKRLSSMTPVGAPITTHSFDIPTGNLVGPPALRASTTGIRSHVAELMAKRLKDGNNAFTDADIALQLRLMLPFEFSHGKKLDLNRAWGNGVDNSSPVNLVVDELQELLTNETVFSDAGLATIGRYQNDYPAAAADASAGRQIFARHLYCLMMLLIDSTYTPPYSETLTVAQQQELLARRVAQWAVNAVDFRDADGIMTRFVYDVNPFNGWDTSAASLDRRVVWGCESPELLLTEAVAFHDRRVRDMATDSGVNKPRGDVTKGFDPDLDQFRIPQGSLFVEMYCPRSVFKSKNHDAATFDPVQAMVPRELYSIDNAGNAYLDLGRKAPNNYPVWRLAVGVSQLSNPADSPLSMQASNPDSMTFDPSLTDPLKISLSLIDPARTATIERIVWFANQDPDALNGADKDRVFWNRNTAQNVYLRPGGYAVVGPRVVTHLGSLSTRASDSLQAIKLDIPAGQVVLADSLGALTKSPALGIIVGASPSKDPKSVTQIGWTGDEPIGINVSEPLPRDWNQDSLNPDYYYYKKPTINLSYVPDCPFPTGDAYTPDPSDPNPPANAEPAPDKPFDSVPNKHRPLIDEALLATGTTPNYRTVFLQRLADPLANYDPVSNPYITVDWCPVDLTVFNGEDRRPAGWDAALGAFDPDDPLDGADTNIRFTTRFRGDATDPDKPNLWRQVTTPPTTAKINPDPTLYFQHNLGHTLGYLNLSYGTPQLATTVPPEYQGCPVRPFPWLTWNNRPYVSPLELMLVPSSSPGRLCGEFGTRTGDNPYMSATSGGSLDSTKNAESFKAPFPHLLNFFNTYRVVNQGGVNTPIVGAGFFQLLDMVEVPSLFVGAEKWFNPAAFQPSGDAAFDNYFRTFRPPFNCLSRFRDPGKVNLNTLFDDGTNSPEVWNALTLGFPNGDSTTWWDIWASVKLSRQGYALGSALNVSDVSDLKTKPLNFNVNFNVDYPTRFAGVFQPSTTADLAPPLTDFAGRTVNPSMRQAGVQATLLRPDSVKPGNPLFVVDPTANPAYVSVTADYRNQDRNPYFMYQGVQRLWNLTTTHSNVFAVWVTLGYFEVDGNGRLGQEVGADTGEIKRHRAFYIIDRSIPVGFKPGENLNTDRCILLKRYIE